MRYGRGLAGNSTRLSSVRFSTSSGFKLSISFGYSKEHQTYVFNDVAVKNGVMHRLNEEDFFDVGKLSVKSLNQSVSLQVNSELKQLNKNWSRTLWTAFSAKGFIALSFWFGSFYAEQIREKQKSYPFMEIVGEPGSGK